MDFVALEIIMVSLTSNIYETKFLLERWCKNKTKLDDFFCYALHFRHFWRAAARVNQQSSYFYTDFVSSFTIFEEKLKFAHVRSKRHLSEPSECITCHQHIRSLLSSTASLSHRSSFILISNLHQHQHEFI